MLRIAKNMQWTYLLILEKFSIYQSINQSINVSVFGYSFTMLLQIRA